MSRSALVGIFLAVALSTGAAHAQDAGLKSVLEQRYAALNAARLAQDVSAIDDVVTPAFRSPGPVAVTNADRIAAEVAALPDPAKTSRSELLSIRADGDAAIVIQRLHISANRPDQAGSPHQVEVVVESQDSWVRTAGVWRLNASRRERMNYLVDGKVVYALTPPPS